MLLNFASDCPPCRPDVLVLVVSMLNTAPLPVQNVVLQAAVPKVTHGTHSHTLCVHLPCLDAIGVYSHVSGQCVHMHSYNTYTCPLLYTYSLKHCIISSKQNVMGSSLKNMLHKASFLYLFVLFSLHQG